MKEISIKTKRTAEFRLACRRAGVKTPDGVGPSTRDALIVLKYDEKAKPLVSYSRSVIGNAVKAGFARYHAESKRFAITERGDAWLRELHAHGLLFDKQEGGES